MYLFQDLGVTVTTRSTTDNRGEIKRRISMEKMCYRLEKIFVLPHTFEKEILIHKKLS